MNAFPVVLVAFGTSVLTTITTLYAVERFKPPAGEGPPQREVPGLVGLSEADARTNLDASGLKLMVAGREPSAQAEGAVLRQDPPPGASLPQGEAVRVTFAAVLPKVPEVAGRSVEEATRLLEELGFSVKVNDPVPSGEHEVGRVVAQSPEAGSPLEAKGEVSLTPSAGDGAVEVPKLVGLNLSGAKAAAEKAGLELAVQWVSLAETATHVVLRQTPPAGTEAEPQSQVKVVINR